MSINVPTLLSARVVPSFSINFLSSSELMTGSLVCVDPNKKNDLQNLTSASQKREKKSRESKSYLMDFLGVKQSLITPT